MTRAAELQDQGRFHSTERRLPGEAVAGREEPARAELVQSPQIARGCWRHPLAPQVSPQNVQWLLLSQPSRRAN